MSTPDTPRFAHPIPREEDATSNRKPRLVFMLLSFIIGLQLIITIASVMSLSVVSNFKEQVAQLETKTKLLEQRSQKLDQEIKASAQQIEANDQKLADMGKDIEDLRGQIAAFDFEINSYSYGPFPVMEDDGYGCSDDLCPLDEDGWVDIIDSGYMGCTENNLVVTWMKTEADMYFAAFAPNGENPLDIPESTLRKAQPSHCKGENLELMKTEGLLQ